MLTTLQTAVMIRGKEGGGEGGRELHEAGDFYAYVQKCELGRRGGTFFFACWFLYT